MCVVRVRACGGRERDVRAGEGEKGGTGMRWGRGGEGVAEKSATVTASEVERERGRERARGRGRERARVMAREGARGREGEGGREGGSTPGRESARGQYGL